MSTVRSLHDHPVRRYAVRGATIAVCELGDTGPPVLLVPGYTGGKEDFASIADAVVAAGFRYFAMDLRGQYESTGPEDPENFGIDALAADVTDLIEAIGERVHAVGHSFGGLVGRAAAISRPDLFRSFTLMSSGPGTLDGALVKKIIALEPVLLAQGSEAVYDALEAINADDPTRAVSDPGVAAFMRRRFVAASPIGLAVMGRAVLDAADTVDELRATGVPLMVCHGSLDDAWSPAVQTEMARRLEAKHVVIEGAGHSPAVEMPAETAAALIEFWCATG